MPKPGPSPVPTQGWPSNTWNTQRTIKAGETDPLDPKVKLLKVGDIEPSAEIANGIMTVKGSSPRVYYTGPWTNVEMSTDVKAVDNIDQSYVIARSDHETRPCGYGGNDFYVDLSDKSAFFKKEIHHNLCPDDGLSGYSSRLASKALGVTVKPGEWYNQKIRVTNIEAGKVKLEGFVNNTKVCEVIDDGSIICGGKKTPPFLGPGQWCYTRYNATDQTKAGTIQYRNMIIKSIG